MHDNKICPLLGTRTLPYKGQLQKGSILLVRSQGSRLMGGFHSDFDAK
nr:MAG TPA: hypothetical protein [Caudoviricetes sp.]